MFTTVIDDLIDELAAVLIEFFLADAVDFEEIGEGGGAAAGHIAEGGVAEDEIGREMAVHGDGLAEQAELFEQALVDTLPGVLGESWFFLLSSGLFAVGRHEQARGVLALENLVTLLGYGEGIEFAGFDQAALRGELFDPGSDGVFGLLGEQAPGAEFIVPGAEDALVFGAGEDGGGIVAAETLFEPPDAGDDFLGDDQRVGHGGEVADTDIAGGTVGFVELLTEVMEQGLMAAGETGAVVVHVVEFLPGDIGGFRIEVLHEEFPDIEVVAAVEQAAFGFKPIPAGPTGFLLIVFDGFGHTGVDDVADVGLVDAHAERNGGDDDFGAIVDEVILIAAAVRVVHAGVIGQGTMAAGLKVGTHFIHIPAADAVDDAGFVGIALDDGFDLAVEIAAGFGFVEQVGPVKRTDQDFGIIEFESFDDIGTDLFGGGGGVGVDPDVGEAGFESVELAVFGAEVVAPHADAMGLVDGDHGERQLAEKLDEPVGDEAFGRHIEDFDFVVGGAPDYFAIEVAGLAAVDTGGGDTAFDEGVDLVFHQGDQGRYYYGQSIQRHGRGLKAERFAPAGGQHHQRITAPGGGEHGRLLHGSETVVTPVAFEDGFEGVQHCGVLSGKWMEKSNYVWNH